MAVHVHVERSQDGDALTAVDRALPAMLRRIPRERPVTLFAAGRAAALAHACVLAVTRSDRSLTRVSAETVGLSGGAGLPTLHLPRSWVGSSLLLVATVTAPGADGGSLTQCLAALAHGAGFVGPAAAAARAGARLALDAFATVVAVVHVPEVVDLGGEQVRLGSSRVVTAVLPRDTRAPAALDAWLGRKLGLATAGPAGIAVRGRAALPWRLERGPSPRRALRGGTRPPPGGERP